MILELPGRPIGKARARVVRRKGKVWAYTPVETSEFQESLGWTAKIAMKGRELLTGPVRIDIVAWFKSKNSGWHTSKPDCDNIFKLIGDSLNSIVYLDDSQVSFGKILKFNGLVDSVVIRCQPLNDVEEPPSWSIPSLRF